MIPSRKALEAAFPGKGAVLRATLTSAIPLGSYASVRKLRAACYHPPGAQYEMETALNEALEGYGTEVIPPNFAPPNPDAAYINLGDTYTTTLLYDYQRDKWIITSWGDWVELQERRGVKYE
jgi:hypothetical protein